MLPAFCYCTPKLSLAEFFVSNSNEEYVAVIIKIITNKSLTDYLPIYLKNAYFEQEEYISVKSMYLFVSNVTKLPNYILIEAKMKN